MEIFQNTEVTGLDIQNGRIHGVQTSRGNIRISLAGTDWIPGHG